MKKIIMLGLAMLLILPIALAQDVESEVQAGITPDSPFYGIDVWLDDFKVNNAQLIQEKARLRIEIAEERLAEMEMLANANRFRYMERSRMEHQKQIQDMEKYMEAIEEDDIKVLLQQQFQKHIMNLERVKEQVPEQAQERLEQAIEDANGVFERNQNRISQQNRETVRTIEQKINAREIQIKSQKGNVGN